MPKFLNDVDINKNQLQNPVIHPSATAPSSPKQGQIYFNTTDNNIYRYDGTQWVTYQNELDTAATSTISIDSGPVAASSNLITSGGVYTAISSVQNAIPTKVSDLTNDSGFITGIDSSDVTTALGYTPADDSGVVHTTGNETISGTKTFNDTMNQKSNLSMRFYGTNDSGRMQFRAQPSDNVIRGTVAITDGYSTAGSGYTGFVTQLVAREGNTASEGFNTIRTSNKGPEYIKENNDGTVTVDKVIVNSSGKYTDTLMGTPTVASGDYLLIDDTSAGTIEKGPAFGSETTKFLRNDGTWQVPPGTGGEPNVIEAVKVNGTALTITDKAVDVPVPTSNSSATTGISIADHSTTTITGVSGSTSVTGVQSTTTTASKVTLGTAISVPNVTSAGSASNWVFENITVPIKDSSSKTIPNVTAAGSGSFTQGTFSGGSFTQGVDSFTANTPTAIDTSKFNGGSFTQGSDSFTAATHGSDSFTAAKLNTGFYTAGTAASFTRGAFSGGSFTQGADSFTANTPTAINTSKFSGGSFTRGSFSGGSFTQGNFSGGSLTITNDTTSDANHHILTFAFSPATHANDTFTAATHANDSFTPASLASGFYTAGTAASFTQGTDSFTAATHANDSFTANTPTAIDVTKFSGGSFTQGSFSGGSFTQGTDNHTAASLGTGFYTAGTAASFTQGEDEFTPATHGADSHTHTPPTLGTAFTITGVQSTTTTASHVQSGGNGTAPTLGTAISIPNVTAATDVTVPIKDASATTVPTAAATATTVVTSKTHSVTDNGHTHTLVVPE